MKPRIFIGSTSEGKKYAQAIGKALRKFSETFEWFDGVFEIGSNTQSSLVKCISSSDFAVIILTADDKTSSRGQNFFSPRDNLIFEAGIGFGAISPDRTFLVPESTDSLKLPTDLSGFTLTQGFTSSNDVETCIAPIVDQIEERVQKKGKRSRVISKINKDQLSKSAISLIGEADRHIMLFGRDLSWGPVYASAIKDRVSIGVDVEVFAENPKNGNAEANVGILKDAGATVHFLNTDIGMKFTMIDHHEVDVARFMLTSKERNPLGSLETFSYNCEIHDARESRVLWISLKRLYESIKTTL